MLGQVKKYWDGKDLESSVDVSSYICDACEEEYDPFVVTGGIAVLPPSGIHRVDADLFICDSCCRENLNVDAHLEQIKSDLSETEYAELIYDEAREILPRIFRLKRKTLNKALREQILKKYQYKCCWCSSTDKLEIDHKKPYSKGGSNHPNNLQVLCKSCNSSKGAKVG